ncbi:branched-chain amino acid aminotransferase [Candidatus Planktophila vernalis]|uniref:Branched-chain amino acid aminotransferase n=1 Tax=Candidatus Planktophila vernalis TaxID=1884907 RepID=A0A249KT11_9ACTN|nr:branched-chain amino acid aminotransferase [Candidatus Planktophila vernalis]
MIYNGEVRGIDDVPATSSGWLEGEGIFETIKSVGNKPLSLSRHIARAQSSAVALGITIPNSDQISQSVTDLFAAVPQGLGMLRISFDNQGNWLAVHMPYAEQEKSCDVRLHPDAVTGDVHKKFPYTNRLAILEQARLAGFDDAVVVNSQGNICEGSVTNLIANIDGRWVTPPTTDVVLPGIIRQILIENELVAIESIPADRLAEITSAFFISSLRLSHAISSIDSRPLHLSHAFGEEIKALAHKYSVG